MYYKLTLMGMPISLLFFNMILCHCRAHNVYKLFRLSKHNTKVPKQNFTLHHYTFNTELSTNKIHQHKILFTVEIDKHIIFGQTKNDLKKKSKVSRCTTLHFDFFYHVCPCYSCQSDKSLETLLTIAKL